MSEELTSSSLLFGTDGIRGSVGQDPITPEFAFQIGVAVAHWLPFDEKEFVLVGGDTRESSEGLARSLANGLASQGINSVWVGVIPTPGISYLTRSSNAKLGIAITASHNPYTDNGYKFFSSDGNKLTDAAERTLSDAILGCGARTVENPRSMGESAQLRRDYIEHCISTLSLDLNEAIDKRVVVDCANGACSDIAQTVFSKLSLTVDCIGASPNGRNINDGYGATDPTLMCKRVVASNADLGIAFDGDGDRIVVANQQGQLLDGDSLIYMLARHLKQDGRLNGGVVGTVMTNMALQKAVEALGIPFERTGVGDRHVAARMRELGWNLGGEKSGHIILRDLAPTGDGLVVALQLLEMLVRRVEIWDSLGDELVLFPQLQATLEVRDPLGFAQRSDVQAVIERAIGQMPASQRVVARPSGTEPVFRVMVEGPEEDQVGETTDSLMRELKHLADHPE